jgi:hypothetical protein
MEYLLALVLCLFLLPLVPHFFKWAIGYLKFSLYAFGFCLESLGLFIGGPLGIFILIIILMMPYFAAVTLPELVFIKMTLVADYFDAMRLFWKVLSIVSLIYVVYKYYIWIGRKYLV